MDRLTQFLSVVFPGLAARRVLSQARLETATRLYDAVKIQNYRPRRGTSASGDAVMDNAKNRLREYGRWLDENHDLAVGVLDDLVTNVVGPGVGIEPVAVDASGQPAEKVNDQLRTLWTDWWRRPEVTGEIPGPELERLICRTWLRDGEVFIQHVSKTSAVYPTSVPYLLEPLEPDFVPFDMFSAPDGVTHGVQKDVWGKPIGYYVYKAHPGNLQSYLSNGIETKFIRAENVTHLKLIKRLHQTRGASIFAAVFSRLDDIKDYEEAERVAARVGAAISLAITKVGDYSSEAASGTTGRLMEMQPGMIFDNLAPGEKVELIDPKRPNIALEPFRKAMMRGVAAGTGSRASSIMRDYNGTYSAQRQELVEGSCHYRRLFSYLVHQFYQPVWQRFVDAALVSGQLRLTPGVQMESVYRPEFRPPSLPWIDPKKEIDAFAVAVQQGFKARWQVIRDLGGDPRQVDALLAVDEFDVRPEEKDDGVQQQEEGQGQDASEEEVEKEAA